MVQTGKVDDSVYRSTQDSPLDLGGDDHVSEEAYAGTLHRMAEWKARREHARDQVSLKIIPPHASNGEGHEHEWRRQPTERIRELVQVPHLGHNLHHHKLTSERKKHNAGANEEA